MFNGPDFPKALDEEIFNSWLENGRASKIGYSYILIIWDSYDLAYRPFYAEHRDEVAQYERYPAATGREGIVAVYDLYSESRIS